MRNCLNIRDKEINIEGNAGTALIYKTTFGNDLLVELNKFINSNEQAEAMMTIKKLAYVMNRQTEEDFKKIYGKLNELDFLEWLSQFEEQDFYSNDVINTIIGTWNSNLKVTSESKN